MIESLFKSSELYVPAGIGKKDQNRRFCRRVWQISREDSRGSPREIPREISRGASRFRGKIPRGGPREIPRWREIPPFPGCWPSRSRAARGGGSLGFYSYSEVRYGQLDRSRVDQEAALLSQARCYK